MVFPGILWGNIGVREYCGAFGFIPVGSIVDLLGSVNIRLIKGPVRVDIGAPLEV